MIKFSCPHCSHKIGAPDDYAGKKARCSKCKQPVRIPTEQAPSPKVIKFRCNQCDQKIAVPAIHVGKRVKCKKCENICIAAAAVAIPAIEPVPLAPPVHNTPDMSPLSQLEDKTFGQDVFDDEMDLAALAAGNAIEIERPTPAEANEELPTDPRLISMKLEPESKPKRKLPWPIDMLLYPASITGILTILFVASNQLLEDFLPFGSGLLQLGIGLYAYWYCCQCIHDSADGGLRAPDTFTAGGFDVREEFWQYLKVLATCLFFVGPLLIYIGYCAYSKTTLSLPVILSLAAYGVLFFPMGLLAMILFDSLMALNPWLLVRSIISTFPQYIGLVVVFYGLGATFYYLVLKALWNVMPQCEQAATEMMADPTGMMRSMLMIKVVSTIAFVWLSLVLCHLLGRFFYKNEEKLYWEV
jgi:hypothetical protein